VAPISEVELPGRVVEEVSLPPPEGATGFAHESAVLPTKEVAATESKGDNTLEVIPKEYFKDRLWVIHGLEDVHTQEREHIKLAKEWNSQGIIKSVIPETTNRILASANQGKSKDMVVEVSVETTQEDFPASAENKSVETKQDVPLIIQVAETESSGEEVKLEESGMETNPCVITRLESMVHYITDKTEGVRQEVNQSVWTEIHNSYIGTEWIMPHGLKMVIRQGDLINETSDVIVNPANSDLQHGGGAARAIAMAARTCLLDECRHYIKRYGGLNIANVVHTTAGDLRPRIKYVLHAIGPDARQISNGQECLDLVHETVLNCLDYTEDILESSSIFIPAISLGVFQVPINDVAQELYNAVV